MLEHGFDPPREPARAVVLGRRGFVASAIIERLARAAVETLPLGSRELDLLAPGAGAALADRLREDDALVVVSAIAPSRTTADLLRNLAMMAAVTGALARVTPAHVVYVSSDAVYADDANPVTERTPRAPSTLHGAMHLARELLLRSATEAPLSVLRPSLLYGARDPHGGYGPNRFRREAAAGEAIALFGEGEERRDHVLVDDLAEIAYLSLAHRSKGVLNVATGRSHTFREVAEAVSGLFDPPVPVRTTPRKVPVTHRHFDVAACMKAFPAFRVTPLAEGLRKAHREALETVRG